jgi:type IV secretory pathway VirD2 relaxase
VRNSDDHDPRFRLRPRKPPIPKAKRSPTSWSLAFRTVMKYARMSRAGRSKFSSRSKAPFLQNCAVRVSYSTNHVAGHWRAHGRYLSREAASLETEKAGFGAEINGVDIASTPQQWQASSDRRLWKLILSPEFGERLDLQRFARDVMSRIESDMHTSLDWVAVAHFNTDHPHVHIALRGVDKSGSEFKLPRDYVKEGVRAVAQHFVTAQLGHRTELDAALAYKRQVPEQRLTPLDRIILRRMESEVGDDTVQFKADDSLLAFLAKLNIPCGSRMKP